MNLVPDPPDGTEEGEGWRRYQPSWTEVLLTSFGLAGVAAVGFYVKTGHAEVVALAAMGGVFLAVVQRWIWPRYRHLWWGEGHGPG